MIAAQHRNKMTNKNVNVAAQQVDCFIKAL